MKELNEKLILLIAVILLGIGLSFVFLFPSEEIIEAKAPSAIKQYVPIDIREAETFDSEWPEAKEQAKGEMFDLFTPPEIFIKDGEFVFRSPYAVIPKGPFGIHLLEINLDSYRFQLEGFVEEDRYDQSKTKILIHSVEDGKSLRLSPFDELPQYGFKILDWQVVRNFNDDINSELIALLKLEDTRSNRIINLRHDEHLYEDSMEILFKASKTDEIYVLSGVKSSFFVEDVEFRLDSVDFDNSTVIMTKMIPGSDPLTKILPIHITDEKLTENKTESIITKEIVDSESIEETFDSLF